MTESTLFCRAADLIAGDMVDLENDRYADPKGYRGVESDHPEFEFEHETVAGVEAETPDCVRVDFESGLSVGFPPDHLLKLNREAP